MIRATCLCGDVTFRSSVPPVIQFVCHCTDCRAATGAQSTRTVIFNSQGVKTTGELVRLSFVAASGSTTHRDACRDCGSVVFDISEQYPDLIGVLAQCIPAPFEFQPSHHIWLQSRVEQGPIEEGIQLRCKGFFDR